MQHHRQLSLGSTLPMVGWVSIPLVVVNDLCMFIHSAHVIHQLHRYRVRGEDSHRYYSTCNK